MRSAESDVMGENQHTSVEVRGNYMMPQNVTLDEACNGLLKAIRYVDDHPSMDSAIALALEKILAHIDECERKLSETPEKAISVRNKYIHISDHIGYVKSFPCVSHTPRTNTDMQSIELLCANITANDLVKDSKREKTITQPVTLDHREHYSTLCTHPNDIQLTETRNLITKLDQVLVISEFKDSSIKDCDVASTTNGVPDQFCRNIETTNKHASDEVRRTDNILSDDAISDIVDDMNTVSSLDEHSGICAKFPQPTTEKPWMCKQCGQYFRVNRMLVNHSGADCCRCDNCGEICRSQDSLQKHTVAYHEVTCSCPSCGQLFSSSAHLQLHHSRYPGCCKCEECAIPFSTERSMIYHFSRAHLVACECSCGMKFRNRYALQTHKKSHPSCCECQTCGVHTVSVFVGHVCELDIRFKCIVCRKNFTLFVDLRKHIQSHLDYSNMRICSDTFHMTLYYLLKQSMPNQELPKHCAICKKNFWLNPLLNNLLVNEVKFPMCIKKNIKIFKYLKEFEQPPLKCTLCPKTYSTIQSFTDHINEIHMNMCHKCDTCGMWFSNVISRNAHVIKYHDEKELHSCTICGKPVLRKSMNRHMHTHNPKTFHCDQCYRSFHEETSFKIHLEEHEKLDVHKCPFCTKTFQFKSLVMPHVRAVHVDELHPCRTCSKSFLSNRALCSHVRFHHPDKIDELNSYNAQRRFLCNTCGKVFRKPFNLHVHMKRHTKEMPYACNICGKRFLDKASCKYHTATHSSVKPYKCSTCGKGFKTRHQCNHHKVLHMGNMAIKCSLCGRVCVSKYNLKMHMLSRHTAERDKPYHCEKCQKGFILKCNLRSHQQVHDNKSVYFKCSKCLKKYIHKCDLLHHEAKFHSAMPYLRCVLCNASFTSKSKLVAHRKLSRCLVCNLELGTHQSLCGHMKAHRQATDYTNK